MTFGRLHAPKRQAPLAEINVTPMVDVMLVLLVIFIVTAPLLAQSIRLDLPRAEGTAPQQAPRFVSLALTASGDLVLDGQTLSLADARESLMQTARQAPDTEIQLRADRSVPYGRVVEVMGAAHAVGLSRIGFVAEPVPAPVPPK